MKKILYCLLVCLVVLGVTGCGSDESNKEVSLNSAYILDYDNKNYLGDKDKAYLIVVLNVKPEKSILLDDVSLNITAGDKSVEGKVYNHENYKSDIVYDSYESIDARSSGKLAYVFIMEKYLYKENDKFDISYKMGTQKGEYSYIIEDKLSINKDNINTANYLEDIVKGVYKENANDALMILSLKWKINDVYRTARAYDSLDLYNSVNYGCYSMGAVKKGNKILNYFAEGVANNVSISNSGYLNLGGEEPGITYELPSLNYDTLEKIYPDIKDELTKLSNKTNEYANGLINVKKSGNNTCFRDITITNIKTAASSVDNLLSK